MEVTIVTAEIEETGKQLKQLEHDEKSQPSFTEDSKNLETPQKIPTNSERRLRKSGPRLHSAMLRIEKEQQLLKLNEVSEQSPKGKKHPLITWIMEKSEKLELTLSEPVRIFQKFYKKKNTSHLKSPIRRSRTTRDKKREPEVQKNVSMIKRLKAK